MATESESVPFQSFVEMTDELFVIHDGERILYMNPGGAHLLGYARAEDAVGVPLLHNVHPSSRALAQERIRASRAGTPKAEVDELMLVRVDGAPLIVELWSARTEFEGRPATRVVARDVTARREAEAEVQRCRRVLDAVEEFTHAASWAWNLSDRQQHWSEANYRLLGLDPATAEPTFDSFVSAVHVDDRPLVLDALGTFDGRQQLTYRIGQPGGEVRTLRSVADLDRDAAGQPVVIHGVSQDVTEFQSPVEQLRLIFEAAPLPVVMIDAEGKILLANPATEQLFGWAPEVLPGNDVSVLAADLTSEVHRQYMHRYARTGEASTPEGLVVGRLREVDAVRRDGSRFTADLAVSLVRGVHGERQYLGLIVDATERKRAEQDLVQSQRLDAVGLLVAGVVHDLNNLFTIISGGIEMARTDGTSGRWLDSAGQATSRAAALVRQLLHLARRDGPSVGSAEIGPLVTRTLALVEATFDRRIMIRSEESPIDGEVVGDPSQLEQVMLNLLVNARDAVLTRADADRTGSFVPRIEVVVGPTMLQGRPAARIEVADNGVGMSAEVRARALDPFYTTKEAGSGTGLGLAVTASVVAQQGGTLLIDSALGIGSTFVVLLPLAEREAVRPRVEPVRAMPARVRRVLVVDDEAHVGDIARAYLEAAGHEVTVVLDGMAAIDAMRSGVAVDMVILDANMPSPSGWEVLDEIQRLPWRPAVIVTSGYADGARAVAQGAAGFLDKPFTRETLLEAIDVALNGPEAAKGR